MMLGSEADVWELKPEDWMANLAIAGVVDEEARKEFMKIDTSKAYQVRNQSNKEVICYVCGNKGHKSGECTLKRDGRKCNNCKRAGHLVKACQSKPDSGLHQKDKRKDRARVAKTEKTERPESDEEEAIIQEARACLLYTSPSPRD